MPVLDNPRHERFAAAIVQGLAGQRYSQGRAYQAAGYSAKDAGKSGGSAEVAASRLLNKVQPILDRVRELQEQAARKKVRTAETIAARLDLASRIAEEDRNPSALASAEQAIAKLLGMQVDRVEQGKPGDFGTADNSDQLVELALKTACPDIGTVSDIMRSMAREELARHASALYAIATGEMQPDAASPAN